MNYTVKKNSVSNPASPEREIANILQNGRTKRSKWERLLDPVNGRLMSEIRVPEVNSRESRAYLSKNIPLAEFMQIVELARETARKERNETELVTAARYT